MTLAIAAALSALVIADAVTPAAALLAHRTGCVAHANPDVPAHVRTIPLLGGAAILAGLAPWLAVAIAWDPRWWALAGAMAPVLALGAYKDRVASPVAPGAQLVVQALAAAILWAGGFRCGAVASAPLDAALTIGLAVVVLNAWNFIDIMDGLAAAVAAATTTCFVIGGGAPAVIAAALAGASLGYLRHNWPPARIFMGDLGSFAIGMTFVALILDETRRGGSLVLGLATMIVPLADLAFTTTSRIAAGKSPLIGGAEHLPLRLVARGWSGVRVNLVAAAVAATAGLAIALALARQ